MKNKREIILDFTSLLDVFMIIMFFFILFSYFEASEYHSSLEEEKSRTEAVIAEYDGKLAELESMKKEADERLDAIKSADERKAENISGIEDFSSSMNLRLYLKMNNDDWILEVFRGDERADTIESDAPEKMAEKLMQTLNKCHYTESSTLLCEFVYDGSLYGTSRACKDIMEMLKSVREKYKYFYYSEVNTSMIME